MNLDSLSGTLNGGSRGATAGSWQAPEDEKQTGWTVEALTPQLEFLLKQGQDHRGTVKHSVEIVRCISQFGKETLPSVNADFIRPVKHPEPTTAGIR